MKKNDKYFYYRLHVKDFLAAESFVLLSLEEKGLLFHCLMSCWCNGSLPASPPELAQLIGAPPEQVAKVLPALVPALFCEKDGRLTCSLLEAERRRVVRISKQKAEAGQKSGESRRCKKPTGNGITNSCSKSVPADVEQASYSNLESDSEPESGDSEKEPKEPTAIPTALPSPSAPHTRFVAADDAVGSALEFLTASGEELGLSPWHAQKFVQESCFVDFPGSASQRLDCLKDAIEQMQQKADTSDGIINPYGLLKTIFQDIVREREYCRLIPAPEFSFNLYYPDSFYEEWLLALANGPEAPGYYIAMDSLKRSQPLLKESQWMKVARRVHALPKEAKKGRSLSDILTQTCREVWMCVESEECSDSKDIGRNEGR